MNYIQLVFNLLKLIKHNKIPIDYEYVKYVKYGKYIPYTTNKYSRDIN